MLTDRLIFGGCVTFNPTFIDFEVTSFKLSVKIFSAFHWSQSISKPRMTPVSFGKTTESYKVCRPDHYLDSTVT